MYKQMQLSGIRALAMEFSGNISQNKYDYAPLVL
jgi:hypothetical protein